MLYLIQHGEAKGAAEDPERDLNEEGVEHARAAGELLSSHGVRIDVVWHSGKLRAAHTARIIAASVGCSEAVSEHEGLAPNDDPSEVAKDIEAIPDTEIMIVGHLPFLERLTTALLGSWDASSVVRFRNAGIVALSRQHGAWGIEWAVPPALFDKEH